MIYIINIYQEDAFPRHFVVDVGEETEGMTEHPSVLLQARLALLQSKGLFLSFTMMNLDAVTPMTPELLLRRLDPDFSPFG